MYYLGIIGIALGYPKPLLGLLLFAEWLLTMKTLNASADKQLRQGLAIWLALSPLFMLPSAVAIWRLHLYGFTAYHVVPALLALPLILLSKKSLSLLSATSGVTGASLFILGVALNLGASIYASAILSLIAGITMSVRPLTTFMTLNNN